ncbi:TetR/AcrR family transcriptional regulator [Corallococcus carmarthensis]|uniref:TetR/AcrR family transcriptional regulator n=1 Tax=Corallococcus carmarthensis TaxID=2316728 RepID=A0A3A8L0T3_9BACT|nr:TetR/AcrR family transcriptional regulator [Corallococcus carmarthensis]NOK16709.1 TetR/AcrR family transcriptional regulator [Corallococcus carmarthensis]RKH07854.1 TetR/AcrR family transcriptional regulator [Corallococcus carmarthensis]
MTVLSILPRQRAAVLEAAREIFARRGFTEASLGDIATRAGLAPVRMPLHFKNKKALFDAVVDEVLAEALAGLEAAVGAAWTPAEKMQTFIEARQGLAERMVRQLRITPRALRDILPLVEPRLAAPRAREVVLLAAIFEEGRAQGTFDVRDTRAAARALAMGLQHVECALLRFGLPPGALSRP